MPDAEKLRALIACHAAGARRGRARGLSALVQLCDLRLLAHARRLSDDAETARDIVQEAWIARALPGLRDEGAFLDFAPRIVTRQAARGERRKRRRVADGACIETRPGAEPPSEGRVDLQAALAALPDPKRVSLALFALDGLSVTKVAQVLEIPPATVKTRLLQTLPGSGRISWRFRCPILTR